MNIKNEILTEYSPSSEEEQFIICVDDDPNFLKSLSFIFPERSTSDSPDKVWYRVLYLTDPLEALSILRDLVAESRSVAMVVSGQKMPQMKGTAFLGEVKKISPDSILILLTGYAGLDSAIESINNKLLDKYLTKPIEDENVFVHDIQHLLHMYQLNKKLKQTEEKILFLAYRDNLTKLLNREAFKNTSIRMWHSV